MEKETEQPIRIDATQEANDKGELIAFMLDLKPNTQGRYETTWGNKTATGLYNCMVRIVRTPIQDLPTE